MIKITENAFLANVDHFLDVAGEGENVLITRADNKNLVLTDEQKFNDLPDVPEAEV